MLKVGSVTKYFKDQKIFSNLDLTVAKGRFHVIVGPSGCGKSTLFDGLTGVIPLDGGSISRNHESLLNLRYSRTTPQFMNPMFLASLKPLLNMVSHSHSRASSCKVLCFKYNFYYC